MIFEGFKFCAHCGARVDRKKAANTSLPCPKCESPLVEVHVGNVPLAECGKCHGLWVDGTVFDQICSDREKQSRILGSASETFAPGKSPFNATVRYVPCPVCKALMHRRNFAKCSGIIVDVCKGHGTWLDKDELQHIVQFIRAGGVEISRQRELREIKEARARLERQRRELTTGIPQGTPERFGEIDLISIAGSLLSALTDRR